MVPILGTVLAVVLADRDNLLRCMALVVGGAVAVVAVGFLVALTVVEPVVAATNSQVASRVAPRLIDLIAALATGAVGSIALARDDISDTLPGVAIAISLVPQLAVVGVTLEAGAGDQALGALLLFVTNVSAILATGLVVMALYRVSRAHRRAPESGERPVHRAIAVIVVGLVVISVPLTLTSVRIADSDLDPGKGDRPRAGVGDGRRVGHRIRRGPSRRDPGPSDRASAGTRDRQPPDRACRRWPVGCGRRHRAHPQPHRRSDTGTGVTERSLRS
jgi:hypothetical protein